MALPATDAFTNTDGVQLTTHSASWTLNDGDFDIITNQISPDDPATGENGAHWNADTFANDHYAKITATLMSGGGGIGVAVRCNTSGTQNYYGTYWLSSGNIYSFTVISGTWTQKGLVTSLIALNDEIEIRATGTAIDIYINSVKNTTLSFTDSSLTTGAAGLSGYAGGSLPADNWEGGDVGGAGATGKANPINGPLAGPLG